MYLKNGIKSGKDVLFFYLTGLKPMLLPHVQEAAYYCQSALYKPGRNEKKFHRFEIYLIRILSEDV